MKGLTGKLIVCPLVVLVSDFIFPGIYYSSPYQPLILGLVLAVFAQMMDLLLLRRGTLWVSTLADLIAAVMVVYFVSPLFPGAQVTVTGALYTAVFLAVTEYYQHLMILKDYRARRYR